MAIDGDFGDWPVQEGSPALRASSDASTFYFSFELSESVVLQAEFGLTFEFDTDGNSATGSSGIDLRWNAGARSATEYNPSGSVLRSGVRYSAYEILTAPTIDSRRFEISLSRAVFSGETIRLRVRHLGSGFEEEMAYTFEEAYRAPVDSTRRGGIQDKNASSDLRLLSYNVLRNNPWNPALRDQFSSQIANIEADLVLFQEIYDHSPDDTLEWLQSIDPAYRYSIGFSDCQIISKVDYRAAWALNGNLAVLFETNEGDSLLVVNVHLPCCNNVSGRDQELARIRQFLREVRAGEVRGVPPSVAVVMAGDFNFVDRDQAAIDLLASDSGLQAVEAYHLDRAANYTWESASESGGYTPGRLDWFFVSEGLLAQDAFVDTDLHPSDHYPVIVDAAFDRDRDGLSDKWERGFYEEEDADPSEDSDEDGYMNRLEYAAGTNPRDPASYPQAFLTWPPTNLPISPPPELPWEKPSNDESTASNPTTAETSLLTPADRVYFVLPTRYPMRYRIEQSTDLETWETLDWLAPISRQISDPRLESPGEHPFRYFRARLEIDE